jgi:SAM-dependent methyltransferase
MKLLKPLPPDRTLQQVENHYSVEKAIADRLRHATREERIEIYSTMYDDLFRQVPDHPRLTRRTDERTTRMISGNKLSLVRDFLGPSSVFVEFAPGDCRFVMEVAAYVRRAYAVDISDQREPGLDFPRNLTLIVYDGYNLEGIEENSVDTVFSDYFIEHLHPEDTRLHLALAYRLLKPGGRYIFRTPNGLIGPHDVSEYFSTTPQGFHLKEWTYTEMRPLLRSLGFRRCQMVGRVSGRRFRLPYECAQVCELGLGVLPRSPQRTLGRYLVPSLSVVATK